MKFLYQLGFLPRLLLKLNIAAREMFLRIKEMKRKAEYAEALKESLNLDFTRESKTLKRVEIKSAYVEKRYV